MSQDGTPGGAQVVVVSYRSAEHLVGCVDSLLRAEGVDRVVVVDNHSLDGSEEAVAGRARVSFVDTGTNLGFGAAANRGVALTDAEFVVVANPDLVVEPGAVAALVSALAADPAVGVVGPYISTPDGQRYPSVRRFPDLATAVGHGALGLVRPDNDFTRRYHLDDDDLPGGALGVPGWVSGTFMAFRRSAFESVGGFDEAYFMYVEDVDLCWRLTRQGWKVAYEPRARVTHVVGGSTRHRPYRMIIEHHRSLWRFARTTTTGRRRPLLIVVAPGLLGRTALACLRTGLGRARARRW